MKCPILSTDFDVSNRDPKSYGVDCLKEECAWWEKEGDGCAIVLLALRLGTVCDELDDVAKELTLIRPK